MTTLANTALVAVVPTIHSSDESTVLGDPFKFFLRRRLGLICLLEYSQALNRGQWLHLAYQHSDSAGKYDSVALEGELCKRNEETLAKFEASAIGRDTLTDFTDRDQDDMHIAAAWWNGACQIQMPNHGTIIDYFSNPNWVLLDREIDLNSVVHCLTEEKDPPFWTKNHPATIRIDSLYYHKKLNAIFPVDLKSCSETPWTRAQRCEIEFQRQLYLDVTDRKLMTLKRKYDIPTDAHLGGMIHVIVQKPPLTYGQLDRRYHYESDGQRKKRKGVAHLATDKTDWFVDVWSPGDDTAVVDKFTCSDEHAAVALLHAQTGKKPEKVYAGEPDPALFARRCLNWYESQSLTDETGQPTCPVNISTTPPLDSHSRAEYNAKLKLVAHYCTVAPDPVNFPKNPSGMGGYGRALSRWAPFYVTPPEHWPEIIQRGHFIVDHRDQEVINV